MTNAKVSMTRRSFLSMLGIAGLTLAGGASLTGCAQTESSPEAASPSQPIEATPQPDPSSSRDSIPFAGNILVAYYSAQGHTKRVGDELAAALNAPTFEAVPVEPYTAEDLAYNTPTNRTGREHDDESLRDTPLVQTTPDDWASYDIVFVGYPIWWDIAAWPVSRFVSGNDFTGKTVIPFCTSASSPMGESGQLLAALAGTGTWEAGQRFSSSASAAEVAEWVESLGLTAAASSAPADSAVVIDMDGVEVEGILNGSAEAAQFAAMLPCAVPMVRYGDREYYGSISDRIETNEEGNYTFEDGDITYCPTNNSVAIFFSQSSQPNLTMGVIPIGKVTSSLDVFSNMGNRVEAKFSAR